MRYNSLTSMKNKIIFITGASGFIGRALVDRILQEESTTKVILLSRTSHFKDIEDTERVSRVIGDINNTDLLVHILKTYLVTHVYHLASEAIVSSYTKNPQKAYTDTVQGVTSMLEAIRISSVPVQKVLIGTSYKVYGKSEPPYNEETHFLPGNTYETAKACQDFIAQDYFRSFKVPVVIFRSVNVYGPGDKNNRLVPKSFADIFQGQSPTVYASFKDSIREFLYIDDLIDALFLLEEKAEPGEIFCIGGHSCSIYEIVTKICEVSNYKGGVSITGVSSVIETKEHALDGSKIRALGWTSKTSLDDGLKKTAEYYKTFMKGVTGS